MSTELSRAQAQHDAQEHPSCFYTSPEPMQRALYRTFWGKVLSAMHFASTCANCETLSRPATTADATSINVFLGFDRPSVLEFAAMLRAGADAAEKFATDNPGRLN